MVSEYVSEQKSLENMEIHNNTVSSDVQHEETSPSLKWASERVGRSRIIESRQVVAQCRRKEMHAVRSPRRNIHNKKRPVTDALHL
mmetsp:Transcript_15072/g.32310  ORF Transcript_15072/g.32310 Transcript_15072/m.32310 type:complete len:86 (+) Transcript_15072:53-310(+)